MRKWWKGTNDALGSQPSPAWTGPRSADHSENTRAALQWRLAAHSAVRHGDMGDTYTAHCTLAPNEAPRTPMMVNFQWSPTHSANSPTPPISCRTLCSVMFPQCKGVEGPLETSLWLKHAFDMQRDKASRLTVRCGQRGSSGRILEGPVSPPLP